MYVAPVFNCVEEPQAVLPFSVLIIDAKAPSPLSPCCACVQSLRVLFYLFVVVVCFVFVVKVVILMKGPVAVSTGC